MMGGVSGGWTGRIEQTFSVESQPSVVFSHFPTQRPSKGTARFMRDCTREIYRDTYEPRYKIYERYQVSVAAVKALGSAR